MKTKEMVVHNINETDRIILAMRYAEAIFKTNNCNDPHCSIRQMLSRYYADLNERAFLRPEYFQTITLKSRMK